MPEVAGTVTYVSADLTHDEQSNASFYTVKIELPSGERRRLNGMTLVSGMPVRDLPTNRESHNVELFVQTDHRSISSHVQRTMRVTTTHRAAGVDTRPINHNKAKPLPPEHLAAAIFAGSNETRVRLRGQRMMTIDP